MMKRILSIFISAAMMFLFSISAFADEHKASSTTQNTDPSFKDSAEKVQEIKHLSAYRAQLWADPKVGDTVYFGNYEQDNDLDNGKEEIEWMVLDREEERILVTSQFALDCQSYNTELKDVTWETSTLRTWLNKDFFSEAFSAEEQEKIPSAVVNADQNPDYDTNPGNTTQDRVFILSIDEANRYFSSDTERQCEPTAYTKGLEGDTSSNRSTCRWWLRSPGNNNSSAAGIDYDGSVAVNGNDVNDGSYTVRPAIWITFPGIAEKYAELAEKERREAELAIDLQTVGNVVTFGCYEQDKDLANGKEPIEWTVLDVQDGKSLLISNSTVRLYLRFTRCW